jgi:hypothetical protein
LHPDPELLHYRAMKFALAIFVFLLFVFFIGWGIVLLLAGKPWLFIAALAVFFGTFAKYGCHQG